MGSDKDLMKSMCKKNLHIGFFFYLGISDKPPNTAPVLSGNVKAEGKGGSIPHWCIASYGANSNSFVPG